MPLVSYICVPMPNRLPTHYEPIANLPTFFMKEIGLRLNALK